MTREETIKWLKSLKAEIGKSEHRSLWHYAEAIDMAIEALEGMCYDEWCDDCKEYDTEKKCCPRFNKVIREALKREPSDDGTLEVKVEDATKIGRVLISDDKHRGGLYYPDEDEPQGDLISRADAIEALGEEPLVWCDEEYEIAERNQWRDDVEAIKSVPSVGRPKGEWLESREQNILMAKRIEKGETWRVCSNCGTGFMIGAQYEGQKLYGERFHNFCPRCGADMRGNEK